jgi:two-component system nitrogen regulation sensor histidine kinase GlnL
MAKRPTQSSPSIDAALSTQHAVPSSVALEAVHAVLDTLATSVAVVDLRSRVKRLNAAFEDLLGVSRRLVVDTKLTSYFTEPELLAQAIDATREDAFTVTRFEASLQPDHQPHSLPVHVIVSRTDEPDTVMVELLPLDKQLRQEREERLVDQALANKELIRGLAHEIKNPLGGIRGAA